MTSRPVLLSGLLAAVTLLRAVTWTETSQSDFADGYCDHHLYASWRGGGAVEFAPRFDLNNDGFLDLFIMASHQVQVCWGSDSGYLTANRTAYPDWGPVDCIGADLDCDGYPEFVSSDATDGSMSIYAGTPAGPSPSLVTVLPGPCEYGAACLAADFDKNGWLDLTIGGYGTGTETYVYWGSAAGYSVGNRASLSGDQPCHNPEAADFNRDGWLDYLQSNDVNPQHVYWGSPTGFSPGNRTAINCPGSDRHHGKSTADLNADGWLDLVFTSAASRSFIFWGSPNGFLTSTTLQSNPSEGGSAVADMNRDGYLDIVFASTPPKIYWGADSGFSEAASRQFGEVSQYSGIFVADLNSDSSLDIFLNDRGGSSPIHWGPDWTSRTIIETDEDHFCMYAEPGNTRDRQYREEYISSVFDAGDEAGWQRISWDGDTPGNSEIEMAVRTGDVAVPDTAWSDWLALANGAPIPDSLDSRFIQYRASLRYAAPAELPMLYEVRVAYDSALTQDVGVDSILRPRGTLDSGTVSTPLAVVRNHGGETAVFSVTMTIGPDYFRTVTETLPAGMPNTIQFPDWVARPVGALPVVCYTVMPGDADPNNDTARASVVVAAIPSIDAGVLSIESPAGNVDSGSVHVPRAVIHNFGDQEIRVPATMRLGADYTSSAARIVGPGQTDTFGFAPWTASAVGPIEAVCYSTAEGDVNPANDTARGLVTVLSLARHDVGTAEILSPPVTLRAGETVTPRALIRNYGNRTERYFDVRFRIPPVYDRTVTVDSVPANSAVDLAFPDWTAVAGLYLVSCTTQLAGDADRTNDRHQVSIRVLQPLDLFIERDQADYIRTGETRDYDFHAEIRGDIGDVVALPRVVTPPGWSAELYDSTSSARLADSDGDGIPDLTFLDPGVKRPFRLVVRAREAFSVDTTPPADHRFVVRGFAASETLVTDSAVLTLKLVPIFEVHNFPNPFDDETRFVIGLPEDGTVDLSVYDRSARLVVRVLADRELAAGWHVFRWAATTAGGKRLAPGTYIYVLDYARGDRTQQVTGRLVISRE